MLHAPMENGIRQSDVVFGHPAMDLHYALGDRIVKNILYRGPAHDLRDRSVYVGPHLELGPAVPALFITVGIRSGQEVPLDQSDDLRDRDVGCGACQLVPPLWSSLAFDDAVLGQNRDYLFEVLRGNVLTGRYVLDLDFSRILIDGDIGEHADGISRLRGDDHERVERLLSY